MLITRVLRLAQTVFEALALALGLESDWFEEFTRDAVGTLRLIHYPPSENTDPKERGNVTFSGTREPES